MKPVQLIIKENITLVIALALPVLLAAFFVTARQVSRTSTEPPRYDFLVTNVYQSAVDFSMIGGKLVASFTYPGKNRNDHYNYRQVPDVYLVNARTMAAEPVPLPLPSGWLNPPEEMEGKTVELFLPGISDMEWSSSSVSPDGYEFGQLGHYDYNLMTEIFSSGRNRGHGITKGGRIERIRGLPQNVYNLRLIAWKTK